MDKHQFKSIENKVYKYKHTKREIKLLEIEIIEEGDSTMDDIGQGSTSVRTITDMTAIKANTLMEDKKLNRMREDVKAIEKVFNSLIDEKQDLIALYYWEAPNKYTWDGIANKLHLSKSTCIRWRNNFIKELVRELGEY